MISTCLTATKRNEQLDSEAAEWWALRPDPDAIQKLGNHYRQFADRCANSASKRLTHHTMTLEEITSAAYLGLMEAIHRYRPEVHSKFTSFAFLRVQGACVDAARDHDWVPHTARTEDRELSRIPAMLALSDLEWDRMGGFESKGSRIPNLEAVLPEVPEQHRRIVRGLLEHSPEEVAEREHTCPAAVLSIAGRYFRKALQN